MYEDKVMGRVPEDICIALLNDYQAEKEKLFAKLAALKQKLEAEQQDSRDVDEFIERLKRFAGAEVLTREMCNELIEYVVVDNFPGVRQPREIYICYKLLDQSHKGTNNLYR